MLSFLPTSLNPSGRRAQCPSRNCAGVGCVGKDNPPCILDRAEQNPRTSRWVFHLVAMLIIFAGLQITVRAESQKLSLAVRNASLDQVFKEIQRQTDYGLIYDLEALRGTKPVSFNVKNVSVEELLSIALRGQPLIFSIVGKSVFIKRKPDEQTAHATETGAKTGLSKSIESSNPPKTIIARGTVFDETGRPLANANITIKETGHGTITNAKGEYIVSEVQVNNTLIISFTGYASQEVKVLDQSSKQVYLALAKNELDKVVIQAYGTTTQRLATGNIATVTGEEIEKHPVMNVLEALQSQVPGVVVQQTSGYASAPFKVEIRGRSVINPNLPSDPLYIIDGVPLTVLEQGNDSYSSGSGGLTLGGIYSPAGGQSPFFSINPHDIESVTVLKDADATAIYGSRGANGVIIITTKKGKAGKTKFNLDVYEGISKVTQHYDLLNTQQYLTMRREAFRNDGISPDASNAFDLLIWDTTKYTDFQKYFWGKTGRTTDIEASINGGDKSTIFRVGGGFHRETSLLDYSGADQRASVQFNLSHKSQDQRLAISFTNIYSYTQSDLIVINGSVTAAPNSPSIFNMQGKLNFSGWQPISYQLSQFSSVLQPYTGKTGFLNSQLTLKYELLKGFDFSTSLGYSTHHVSQKQLIPIISQDPSQNPKGQSSFGNTNGTRSIVEPQLEYTTIIGRGKLNSIVGGSVQSVAQDGNTLTGSGYTNDNLLGSVGNAPTVYGSNISGQYKYAALFGRITYNWENEYVLNISARRDGSSRFGPGKQFGNFGAIGAAWIFSEEKWFSNHFPSLSFGKIRGSYGLTGNDGIGDYQFISHWSAAGNIPYQAGIPSYVPLIHANPGLQWEVNKKLEAALVLGFFKDHLNLEVAWYQNRCSDQLLDYILPSITGFSSVAANLPATVQNTGVEVTIRTKIIDKKNFGWSLNGNVGVNHNRLVSFPNLAQSSYASLFEIGKPLNITYLLHYTGVDPLTGQYTFMDKNKDGQISTNPGATDDRYAYDLNIKFDGGMGTDLNYKGWMLSLFFTFRMQKLPSAIYFGSPGQVLYNQSTKVLDHWQKAGDIAKFARFTTNPTASDQNFTYSDGVYSDGSYIRLRNLSLLYDVPGRLVKKIGMQGCKIYLRGENLLLLSRYDGLDPDVSSLGAMPPSKIITSGIQVSF